MNYCSKIILVLAIVAGQSLMTSCRKEIATPTPEETPLVNNTGKTSPDGSLLGYPSQSIANGIYQLKAVHSGKAMDVDRFSMEDGTPLQQFTWNGGDNQHWQFTYLNNGYYKITAVHSGKAITTTNVFPSEGGQIIQKEWANLVSQWWIVNDLGNYQYSIVHALSGRSIGVAGGATWDGAKLVPQIWYSSNSQKWFIAY
ncbi:hypothetical protein QFZ51_005978 [Chitinophaga sp. W3I9]|uniref:RICIN domain-containing protein n=1 Tax=unclassified Chitinophaga TaxID=2619133 RepID=UPI003D1C65F2